MKKLVACLAVLALLGLSASTWAIPEEKKGKGKDKKAAATCPISKKAVNKEVFVSVNGQKTFLCCEGCVKPYKTKVLKLEDKGPQKCELSGQPAKAATQLIHRTAKEVGFCCNNCKGKYLKTNGLAAKESKPGKCPMSGKPAKADFAVNVNGENVYFCCNNCPKAYVAKKLGVKPSKDALACPFSGKPAKDETKIVHVAHKAVYFCCNNCKGKYAKQNFAKKAGKKAGKKKDA